MYMHKLLNPTEYFERFPSRKLHESSSYTPTYEALGQGHTGPKQCNYAMVFVMLGSIPLYVNNYGYIYIYI